MLYLEEEPRTEVDDDPGTEELSPADLLDLELESGPDDWQITPHGRFLGEVLARNDLVSGKHVLELGAGQGNHTIVMLRRGPASLVATEITDDLIATTRANVEKNVGTDAPIEYRVADWLHTEGSFDVVVANPPFAKSGKTNRRYFIDALILDAHRRLRPGGELVFVQSSMADIAKTLRRLDENGFDAEVLARHKGPFRSYYYEDAAFMEEIERVPEAYELRDGEHWETLFVVHAKLRA